MALSKRSSFCRDAFTLDFFGNALVQVYGGGARKGEPLAIGEETQESLQAQRLAHTLNIYLAKLEKPLLDLMTRLCVFRFGVTGQALGDIFLKDKSGAISGSLANVEESQLDALLAELTDL